MSNDQHRDETKIDETPTTTDAELNETALDGVSGGLSGWCSVPTLPGFKPKPTSTPTTLPSLPKPQPSILVKL